MKKIVSAVALLLAMTLPAHASQVVNNTTGYVESANCVLVTRNESMSGGLVGGALGGAGGALVGSLFGKKGRSIGAIGGALGGAAYGASGSKVYNCTLLVSLNDGTKQMVTKVTETPIEQHSNIGVAKMADGSYQAL
jgi:outer membrane lipoprotein SlyB